MLILLLPWIKKFFKSFWVLSITFCCCYVCANLLMLAVIFQRNLPFTSLSASTCTAWVNNSILLHLWHFLGSRFIFTLFYLLLYWFYPIIYFITLLITLWNWFLAFRSTISELSLNLSSYVLFITLLASAIWINSLTPLSYILLFTITASFPACNAAQTHSFTFSSNFD